MKKVLMVLGLLLASGGCSSPTDNGSCGLFSVECGFGDPFSGPVQHLWLVNGVVKENGIPTTARVRVTMEKDGREWSRHDVGFVGKAVAESWLGGPSRFW